MPTQSTQMTLPTSTEFAELLDRAGLPNELNRQLRAWHGSVTKRVEFADKTGQIKRTKRTNLTKRLTSKQATPST